MIKIGSVHAALEDADGILAAMLERFHSLDLIRTVAGASPTKVFRGKNLLFPNYPSLPCPAINQLVIPTGATRWSFGLFLVTTSGKDAIIAEARQNEKEQNRILVQFHSDDSWRDPETDIPFSVWMHPLQPRRLSPQIPDGKNQYDGIEDLWLIPMVDRRYFWQFKSIGKLSDESFTTVESFVEYLEEILECRIAVTCLNSKYASKLPDILEENDFENAAVVLETLAWHVGCQFVPLVNSQTEGDRTAVDGLDFALISVDDSPVIYANNLAGKIGVAACAPATETEPVSSGDSGWESVGLPQVMMGGEYQSEGEQLPAAVLLKGDPDYREYTAEEVAAIASTIAGNTAILRLTYKGHKTIPDDLAKQIAGDYYKRFEKLYDWTFAGIQPWQPTCYDDCIIMFQRRAPSARDGSVFGQYDSQTRVRGWIANLLPESPQTGSASPSATTSTPDVFTCGDCLSCLESDGGNTHSDCASADPSPNSWFTYDDASACCDNIADSNIELIHQSGCLWESEERECSETFIDESLEDPNAPSISEDIYHKWILEVDGDWVVLTHRWYRKT